MTSTTHNKRTIVRVKGTGFCYTLYSVDKHDVADFEANGNSLMLRRRFRQYDNTNDENVKEGLPSRKLRFCTVVSDSTSTPVVTATDCDNDTVLAQCDIGAMRIWRFISAGGDDRDTGCYTLNIPTNIPGKYETRLRQLLIDHVDACDATDINDINDEFSTFFNIYTPKNEKLLCRRSRDNIMAEFVVEHPAHQPFDLSQLYMIMQQDIGAIWNDGSLYNEYDANYVVYRGRLIGARIRTLRESNADYFVTDIDPTSPNNRFFESWASESNNSELSLTD